jgi:hypothetical protein
MSIVSLCPFLTLAAVGLAFVPTIEDSGHRALTYWLVIPPLVAGVLAACTRCLAG